MEANQIPLPLPPVVEPQGGEVEVQAGAQTRPLAGRRAASTPRTFQELFQLPDRDPFQGNYERVMQRFTAATADGAQIVDGATLYRQATTAPPQTLQAYLLCAAARRGPRIYCVHSPSLYHAAFDGTVTPWDDLAYAFLGEPVQGIATLVQFPATAFNVVNAWTKTATEVAAHMDQFNEYGVLTAVQDHDETVTLTFTRLLMYLPNRYVHLLLDSRGFSPQQVWERLYPEIIADQAEATCTPVLNWLRVASTSTVVIDDQGNERFGHPANAIVMTSPTADQDLLTFNAERVHQLLPALRNALPLSPIGGLGQPTSPNQNVEQALTQVAQALVLQANTAQAAQEARLIADATPKLPSQSDKFKHTVHILQALLNNQDERLLPGLWQQWANCPKKQEFIILRDLLDNYARGPSKFSNYSPVVTIKLVQDLTTFDFIGISDDDYDTGLSPFAVADGSASHRAANLELSKEQSLLLGQESMLLYADIETIKKKTFKALPLTYYELEKALGLYGNLLGTVLGDNHPVTVAYRAFWERLIHSMRDDLQTKLDTKGYIRPAHIMRSIQLDVHAYFEDARKQITPKVPDFQDLLHRIRIQNYVLPRLPPPLYALLMPTKPTSTVAISQAQRSGTTSTTPSAASVSDMSSLSGTLPPSLVSSKEDTFVPNTGGDPALQKLVPRSVKLRDLIGKDPEPLSDSNRPLCLSYHLRTGCWSNCKRGYDHNRTLTAPEKIRLENFVNLQLAKLQSMTTPKPE